MKETCEHPWQNGPRELFRFAMNTLQTNDDVSQRIAFLLFDVCVETTLRTYLALPDGTPGSQLGHSERRKYAVGNFHELTRGVSLAAKERVPDVDLHHLKFYHDIRNRLYHQGNGISVRSEYVRGYAALATTLLKQLLDIDCSQTVPLALKQDIPVDQDAFNSLKRGFPDDIDRFKHLINLVMESTEPRMIYPSTIRTLAETSDFDISSFPKRVQEFRDLIGNNIADKEFKSWLLNFLADDLCWDRPQVITNTQFLMGLGKDPISFYSFMIGIRFVPMEDVSIENLDNWDDISFIAQDEYSLAGLYDSCRYFEQLLLSPEKRFGISDSYLFERSRGLQSNLRLAIKKLEALRPNQALLPTRADKENQ